MHWADINAALYKAGWTPRKVQKKLGLKQHNSVSQTIRGQITSYNIASFVSVVTGIPLAKLFPDGRYSRPHPRRTPSRRAAA